MAHWHNMSKREIADGKKVCKKSIRYFQRKVIERRTPSKKISKKLFWHSRNKTRQNLVVCSRKL